MRRDEPKHLTFQPKDMGPGRAADECRILGHDVHHGLEVGRGAGDDPQDLRRRGLLLEGLGQLAVPRLELREQAHVLDGDDRLVGEGSQQRYLSLRERSSLGSSDADGADGPTFPEHGHDEIAAISKQSGQCLAVLGLPWVVLDVGEMLYRAIEDGAAYRTAWVRWTRIPPGPGGH